MKSPMTLKELAQMLNLAPSTVSRALKGHPDISKATQERVRALADLMQYKPSVMASGLRNQRSYLLAVIVPDFTDYFYSTVLRGIACCADANGYRIMVFESQEHYQKEVDICLSLQKSGIDGLLVSPSKHTSHSNHFKELKAAFPVVFFGRMLGDVDADRIIEDDYYGACIAMNYLIESGCRKIAHLAASQQWLWAQKRQMGYVQAMLDHHLIVDRELIVEYHHPEEVDKIVEELVRKYQIDGIFAVDDESAARALFYLHQQGVRVPGDISVCGYGNDPITRYSCPSLTTVDRKGEIIGREAAELLIARIEGKLTGETETRLLKNSLIVRESTLELG